MDAPRRLAWAHTVPTDRTVFYSNYTARPLRPPLPVVVAVVAFAFAFAKVAVDSVAAADKSSTAASSQIPPASRTSLLESNPFPSSLSSPVSPSTFLQSAY